MRRAAAALLVTAVTGLSGLTVATADPTPTPSGGPEAPLQVVVRQLLPRAPQAHDAVEVSGYLRNTGPTTISQVSLRLRVGNRITTRGDLHDADTDRPITFPRVTGHPTLTTLAPGEIAPFDVRTTVDALGISRIGDYPVDIEARGDTGDGSVESLGLAPTWIPFFVDTPNPVRVAVVWPLVDRPRQGTDSTLLDDGLAASLAPSGRLGQLLAAARGAETRDCGSAARGPDGKAAPTPVRCDPVPITYAVDPDLLVAAHTMASRYQVQQGTQTGKTVDGTGTAAATAWLSSLKEGVTAGSLLALPFADPDVTPLSRTAGGREDLARATLLGRSTVADVLGTEPLDGIAYPPPGTVSKSALDTFAHAGTQTFVLDASAFGQPDSDPFPTPSARTVLATSDTAATLDGLVPDEVLSDLVNGASSSAYGARLAEQRFLAETAIIAAEAPGRTSRTLLIAPERRGSASVVAATEALRDLGRVPWLCPVSLAAVAGQVEQCPGSTDPSAAETREALRTDPAGQLSQAYLAGVAADRDVVGQLTDAVLSDKQDPAVRTAVAATKERLRRAVARAESSAWRGDPAAAQASAGLLHTEVTRLTDKLVVRGGRALLTSDKGTLQVSIENTLDVPVDVRVRFSSNTATLPAAVTGLVEVTPGHAVQAGVKAEAQRSGQFVVFAQIVDRNGKPFGPKAEVIVRSTRFGRLALAVTAGGFGVLLVAAGVRIVRRAVRRPTSG
jgi:hypothetical protein